MHVWHAYYVSIPLSAYSLAVGQIIRETCFMYAYCNSDYNSDYLCLFLVSLAKLGKATSKKLIRIQIVTGADPGFSEGGV